MMRSNEHVVRTTGHLWELALLAVFLIVCIAVGVGLRETTLHMLFAISTMSLVNCINCCMAINLRYERLRTIAVELFKLGRESPAHEYESYAKNAKTERNRFLSVTVISSVLWIAVAAAFATAIMARNNGNAMYVVVAATVAVFLLSLWKVYLTAKAFPQLELSKVARLFSERIPEEPVSSSQQGESDAVVKPR